MHIFDLEECLAMVKAHLDEGSPRALAYAALECRLAIERICYQHLRQAHDYISHDDLRREWRPRHVMRMLSEQVDSNVDKQFTMYISRNPSEGTGPKSKEEYEATDWVKVGEHVGFDGKFLAKLWNGLSNSALHVQLPKSSKDGIPLYGDADKTRRIVEASLTELERINGSTLIASGFGASQEFTCKCGQLNKRRDALLSNDQIVSCVGPNCSETYAVSIASDGKYFTRRTFELTCNCGQSQTLPLGEFERMANTDMRKIDCECGSEIVVAWRLWAGRKPDEGQIA